MSFKRRNNNSQLRKEEVEDDLSFSSKPPTGSFQTASNDQLKSRKIIKVSKVWTSNTNSKASSSEERMFNSENKMEKMEVKNNPFSSVNFSQQSSSASFKISCKDQKVASMKPSTSFKISCKDQKVASMKPSTSTHNDLSFRTPSILKIKKNEDFQTTKTHHSRFFYSPPHSLLLEVSKNTKYNKPLITSVVKFLNSSSHMNDLAENRDLFDGKVLQQQEYLLPVSEIAKNKFIPMNLSTKLNLAFLRRIQMNQMVNPLSNYVASCKEYLRRAKVIEMNQFDKHIYKINDIKKKMVLNQHEKDLSIQSPIGDSNTILLDENNNLKKIVIDSSKSQNSIECPTYKSKKFITSLFSSSSNNIISSRKIASKFSSSFNILNNVYLPGNNPTTILSSSLYPVPSNNLDKTSAHNIQSKFSLSSKTIDELSSFTNQNFSTNNHLHNNVKSVRKVVSSETKIKNSSRNQPPIPIVVEDNTTEDVLYQCRAKFSRIDSENKWKCHSAGVLRLYRHKSLFKHRIVIRNEVGQVHLNVAITKGHIFKKVINEKKKIAHILFVALRDEQVGVERLMLTSTDVEINKLYETLKALE